MNLDTPIQYIKGVGPKMAARLKKIGIEKVQDLIFYFPRSWDDLSNITQISHFKIGNAYNTYAKIIKISNSRSPKKRMNITSAVIQDADKTEIKVLWFNQPFLTKNLIQGESWIFSGKVEWDFGSNSKIMVSPTYEKKPVIISIYPETEGVTSKYLRKLLKNVLEGLSLLEFIPNNLIEKERMIPLEDAVHGIHFPSSIMELKKAKERLAFDELFVLVIRMINIKKQSFSDNAPRLNAKVRELVEFSKKLPYKLTNAQRKASWEIIQDLSKTSPMNRLLEGDVGSGKTVVAAMAAFNAIKNNQQVVWMAPTEILANQHFENAMTLFDGFDVKITLLTSKQTRTNFAEKKQNKNIKSTLDDVLKISNLVIGTHALIQEGINFYNMGLAIIDEQHRFGVKQRAMLKDKANCNKNTTPHFLSMTATPIPRTLALSIYGDLDISVLDELPAGRQKVITRLVDPVNKEKAFDFIKKEVENGRQAFVICPLIESNDKNINKNDNLFSMDKKSVMKVYEKLSKEIFPKYKIAYLHGKMKSREKESVMDEFKNNKIQILVATSVIEVGIDIPNATIIMIEDANRFGLAQLHQFRGRVGRGKFQSYCFLFTQSLSPEINKRLQILAECSDGFKLAEKDLLLRGHGDLAGTLQHGVPDLKIASLTDIVLINRARYYAELILTEGLEKYPLLVEKIKEFETAHHLE
jgi:ATP-dependent DNA helicase RecG